VRLFQLWDKVISVLASNARIMVSLNFRLCGGDQGWLSGTFTEVKQRRARLVLGWVTIKEDGAL